ncbi:hypothetical protein [Gaoshiqia sediminis]|uniref:Uncharacterized protein n=1 Tax=Gaoshiqia sediminis TaxID=2986998 RepID=A0AA41YAJ6_9BACT|nr:hypothetical protein [Gaoshiqia sediminis]MCW0482498.1 hypothetical protein [Gaoshiqia sediminis]
MEISNKKRTRRIKRIFNLVVVFLLLVALFFVWKENNAGALIAGGVLVLFVVGFQFVNMNYVYYSSEGGKLLVRYYPVVSLFGKEYNAIEFDKHLLYSAKVKKVLLFSDLYLSIRTSKGIAEYPEVSLAGLSREEIQAIQHDLTEILQLVR